MLDRNALIKGYIGPSYPWACIVAPKNANLRSVYNDIEELSKQIEDQGLLEPLVLKLVSKEPLKLEVVSGFRRYSAIELLNPSPYTEIPGVIRSFNSEGLEKLAQLAENTGKETVKNYDLAIRLTQLENDYKIRRDAIVKQSGLSASTVSQLILCLKPIKDGGLSPAIIDVWRSAQRKEQEIPLFRLNQWRGKPEEIQLKLLKEYQDGEDSFPTQISDEDDDTGPKIVNKSPGKREIRRWLKEVEKRIKKEDNVNLQSAKRVLRWVLGELKEPL